MDTNRGLILITKKERSWIQAQASKVMNSVDFANLQFDTIGYKDKWQRLIGDPSLGFSAMIFGRPRMGKSYLLRCAGSLTLRNIMCGSLIRKTLRYITSGSLTQAKRGVLATLDLRCAK